MKIAVLVPCYRDPAYQFTISLVGLMVYTVKARPDIELGSFWTQSTIVSQARNRLLDDALNWGADYAFFLDCDQTYPMDALLRLLAHNLEVVGVNPSTRVDPPQPTAANIAPGGALAPVWTTKADAEAGRVERVDRIGFGVTLIKLSIVPRLLAEAEARGEPLGPLFHFRLSEDGRELTGEDFFFCERLERAGIPIHVDHGLSWETGHVGERVLFPADTEISRIVAKAGRLRGR